MNLSAIYTFLQNNAILFSFIAFLLSIVNFVYMFFREKENKRRWEATNLARLVIKDLRMVPWRKLPRVEFESTNWGYNDAFGFVDVNDYGVMNSDVLQVPASVVAIDSNDNIISGTNAITISELTTQLSKRGYDPNIYTFVKLFRVCFAVENTGSTVASDIEIQVEGINVDGKIPSTTKGPIQVLQPGERTWSTTNLSVDISDSFPKEFKFHISIKCSDINKNKCRLDLSYIFERSVGVFRRA